MNNHKKSFETEYLIFARKWRPLLMLALLAVSCTANFFIAGVFWQMAVLTGPVICVAVLCFMDYFVFAGFNSRKSAGMNLLKTSPYGRVLVEAALKQDIVNKAIYVLIGSVTVLISIFIFNPDVDKPFVIAYAIGGYSTCMILLRLVLLIDRAKGLTMQVHVFICYLFYSLGTVILIPLIFLSETFSLPLLIVYDVAAEIGSVLMGRWLINSCMKAYDSSFHDEEEKEKDS